LPACTKPCDLRIRGDPLPIWDETILYDLDVLDILQYNVLILFELLDFNFALIKSGKYKNKLNSENLYKIAWG